MAVIKFESPKPFTNSTIRSLVVAMVSAQLCSASSAILAITKFNYSGLLTALQFLTSVLALWILSKLGFLHHDSLVLSAAKKFFSAAAVFYLAMSTNADLLRHANADISITFRSFSPLFFAIAGTLFRKQSMPSKLTFFSLVIMLGGAVGYMLGDSAFSLTAYSWAFAYLVTITTEVVCVKHMVTIVGLNIWGFVLHNNFTSFVLSPFFWFIAGEHAALIGGYGSTSEFHYIAILALMLSCAFGLSISFLKFA